MKGCNCCCCFLMVSFLYTTTLYNNTWSDRWRYLTSYCTETVKELRTVWWRCTRLWLISCVIYRDEKNTSGCSVIVTGFTHTHPYVSASGTAWGLLMTWIWPRERHHHLMEPNGTNQTAVLHIGDREWGGSSWHLVFTWCFWELAQVCYTPQWFNNQPCCSICFRAHSVAIVSLTSWELLLRSCEIC